MSTRKKKTIIISLMVFVVVGFIFFNVIGSAFASNNDIAIKYAKLSKIKTGTGPFDSGDDNGNDSSDSNRFIRSFDVLTYSIDYDIKSKNGNADYEDRIVNIKVTLPDNVAKYVSFSKDEPAGETTKTFSFKGASTYDSSHADIELYVLGAPNKTEISPKFEIQESTNTDANYVVTLGSASEGKYNYEYDEEDGYSNVTSGYTNYMPTIVSSKTAQVKMNLIGQSNEGQRATYNDSVGRYLTYIFGFEIVGSGNKGIKGYTMPDGSDITFDIGLSQNGNNKLVDFDEKWVRLYGSAGTDGIESVVSSFPYSNPSDEIRKRTRIPGNISVTKSGDGAYKATIKGYNLTYSSATSGADSSALSINDHYVGTYALSIFSARSKEDAKKDITSSMSISNIKMKDTVGSDISVGNVSANSVNKYYEVIDYSLTGEFYDQSGVKLSSDTNGKGSISKGTDLVYKTVFNYKKTLSDQGLKEVIKVDPKAYRVMPYGDKDIKITVENSDGSKLSQDDFEVKFVSGNYSNSNYSASNNSEVDSRIVSEDVDAIKNACSTVNTNLKKYSDDQVMNLYGGPCLTANEDIEKSYDKVEKAKENDAEVPITKVIVQTKKGVKLPDSTKVTIEVGIRVRNVSDLTQTYQATVVATSSDYDSNLTYYAPRITSDENSITNPDNYKKTVYKGNTIASIDTDSVWGDSLKILNFKSTQTVTVTNKNKDGTVKTQYNANTVETIKYNIKTNITDENMNVGADDVWYINHLKVYVTIPKELTYVADKKLGTPEVSESNGVTTLIYTLPYTKPNMKIKDINFKATIKPNLTGSGVPITVSSRVEAININNETDTSIIGNISGSFTIYATGIQNVIVSQKVGESGSIVEKDAEFSYLLGGYNNTSNNITDYNIVDVLPKSGDKRGSSFGGSYKVKVTLPTSLSGAKVLCSKQNTVESQVFNQNNKFEECNILDEYVDATAIRIEGISIAKNQYMEDITLSFKPTGNNYSDRYINSFVGGSQTYSENQSNELETRVVSRTISGRVFVDYNENGIEDDNEKYVSDIPMSLYKYDSDNKLVLVRKDVVTDKNGYYEFKDLDVGRYKIRANYDKDKYDLTLRYATEDTEKDSDAYKIEDGVAEISSKRTPNDPDGISVTRDVETVENMNIGFISKQSFGFNISKYITKIDLNYNNTLTTTNYDNQTKVLLSVKKTLKATARVYYGIKIENNSTKAGYVNLIDESIPNRMNFSSADSYNSGWFYQDGSLRNVSLAGNLIHPGESRYLKIVLDLPSQEEAGTYINTVTLLDIEEYKKEPLAPDTNPDSNTYEVGEGVMYAGVNWHVVKTEDGSDGEQMLTLLADSGTVKSTMGHTNSKSDTYKWSTSNINKYVNEQFANTNSLNLPILADSSVCDDASGLPVASFGGSLEIEKTCQSAKYNTYKVRLLTESEYNNLISSQKEDLSWLYGNSDFWLMNSVYVDQKYDPYGRITDITNVKNLAKYVSKSSTSIQNGYNSSSTSKWVTSNTKKEVRPVITVSNKNVISAQ